MLPASPVELLPYLTVREKRVTIGFGQTQQLVGTDTSRILLMFATQPTSGDVRLRFGSVASDRGIRLTVNQIYELWFGRHGILTTLDWYGSTQGGTGDIWVIEMLYRPPRKRRV